MGIAGYALVLAGLLGALGSPKEFPVAGGKEKGRPQQDMDFEKGRPQTFNYSAADGGKLLSEEKCLSLTQKWVKTQEKRIGAAQKEFKDIELAIFLHVPRTAGRSVHRCVLKNGFQDKCDKSYDALRYNFSDPNAINCGLFVSHQDHRIIDQAHSFGRPWVVTMLRDPVGRVLSSYEFAVEVAARRLGYPVICDLTKVCTRHVWPWTHLVPYFDVLMNTTERVATMRYRKHGQTAYPYYYPYYSATCSATDSEKCAHRQEADILDEARDPYNCSMYQPLEDFLAMDMAQDLLDNAATFQVLGLSELTPELNQGSWSGGSPGEDTPLPLSTSAKFAGAMRRCSRTYGQESEVNKELMKYALHRLENYVDVLLLHERLDDSMSAAVHLLRQRNPRTGKILGKSFQACISHNADKMKARKQKGMENLLWKDGEENYFGEQTRKGLAADRVESIRKRNWMDTALHKRAVELFDKRFQRYEAEGMQKVKKSVKKIM